MSVPASPATLTCADPEAFACWLDEHASFEDAMVRGISPTPAAAGESPPGVVNLELAYQVGGGLRAGDTRQLRRVRATCSGVTHFELADPAAYSPDHWSEGIELLTSAGIISFTIDVPGCLRIDCARVDVEELPAATETVLPWESDREISITVIGGLPSPSEIVKRCAAGTGVELVWRIYSAEVTPLSQVPTEDYEGWFLQLAARVPEDLGGIMLGIHRARERTPTLTLTRMASIDDPALWAAVLATFATFEILQAKCGNRELDQDGFRELAERKGKAAGLRHDRGQEGGT